jgi:hypothetical protein
VRLRFPRWIGPAVLGAVVALLVNLAFGAGFAWLTHGDLLLLSGPYWTYSSDQSRVLLLTSLPLFAHAVGGFVAGKVAESAPGLIGVLSAVFAALVAAVRVLLGVLASVLTAGPDAVPFSEDAGFLFYLVGLFVVYFPFTVLAGYAGGRLGGRRAATRP